MKTLACAVLGCMVLTGCGHAPIQAPRIASMYPETNAEAKTWEIRTPTTQDRNGTPTPVILISRTKPSESQNYAVSAANILNASARSYAAEADYASDFKIKNDIVSLGLLTFAGAGVLTNAHSDFVKGIGALFGLSVGTDLYLNPKEQKLIYMKAAEASQCSSDEMVKLEPRLRYATAPVLDKLRETIPVIEEHSTAFLYNANLVEAMRAQPFAAATIVNGAVRAHETTVSLNAAVEFIDNISNEGYRKNRTIGIYIISSLTDTAFNRDAALKKIAELSVSPDQLLAAVKELPDADSSNFFNVKNSVTDPKEKEKQEELDKQVRELLKQMPKIVETINRYGQCTAQMEARQ